MGNSPLTVCISQVWEKQTVQVVLPDGQVLFMPHPVTVAMLMEAHPGHFVCQGSPSLLEQRLPIYMRLESGEIYYLLPSPDPVVTATTPTRDFFNNSVVTQRQQQQQSFNAKSFPLKVPFKPPPSTVVLFDKTPSSQSFSDYGRLSLKPQQCVINLFVFRQSVASIMPEESFRPGSPYHGDLQQQYVSKPRNFAPPVLNNKGDPPQLDQPPKQRRGRKQVAPWKPYLESISETKAVVHDFSSSLTPSLSTTNSKIGNYVNDFSLSMISSGIKTLGASPRPSPPGSPLHNSAFPVYSYGGGQQQQQQQQRLGNLIRPGSPLHNSVLPVNSYGGQLHQQQFQQQQFQQQQRQRFGGMIHSPLAGDRDSHRQKFIYSV